MHYPQSNNDFWNDLTSHTQGDVRTDLYSRVLYSTDASIYQVMPYGLFLPKSSEDVQTAVSLAAAYNMPILARTAGSSLAGQAVNEALIIDFTRHLDQILELNVEEKWVRVQPGVVLDNLNAFLRPYQLQFGPDPASANRAGMGGIISNNATGSHSILYGMAADHLLKANVILSDGSATLFGALSPEVLRQKAALSSAEGRIYKQVDALVIDAANQAIIRTHTPRHWRRCGGYNLDRLLPPDGQIIYHRPPQDSQFNLAKLFSGAEGTLGIITELTLKLVPVPRNTAVAIVEFDDLHTALTAVPQLLETSPSAIELMDYRQLNLCRQNREYARLLATFVEGEPTCILITEFYGSSDSECRAKLEKLQQTIRKQGVRATAVTPLLDPQRQQNVWQVRKGGLGLLMSMKGDYKPLPFIEDAAVPVEHLDEYVTKLEQFCADLGTEISYYAHASAGCLHIRPIIDAKQAREVVKLPQIAQFAVDLLKGYGGAWSSEHGDGRSRSWLNKQFFGPELYGLYQQVKHIFDPENLFNPGNIVSAGSMTDNLRYGGSYQTIPLRSQLAFTADGGFHRAVEMCNGAGVCRKLHSGSMCPSFMATREEEHSTRGRANALRAALSGTLPPAELTSKRMYEVMALCVSCKACKSECPSSVDMAQIKTEFLVQYQAQHGVPLRSRLFAHINLLSRLGSGRMAPLANWSLRSRLVRAGMARFLAISRERELPPFVQVPFMESFQQTQRRRGTEVQRRREQVVLFVDTYHNHNYPHVAHAAVNVLEAAGFAVIVPPVHDCGRPAFSKGLVKMARKTAVSVLNALTPYVWDRLPILFLEPSDQSMVSDDYEALLPDDVRVRAVAQQCTSFEQFIAQQADNGTLNLTFTDEPRHIVLHGHCHQKALVGTKPAHQALTLPPNYTLAELDTSCCGMAGSFGYEAEHLHISLNMAERRLLPGVRAAAAGTLIVAAGVSCRQQIKHGTGRRVLHPAEVLRDALVKQA